MINSQHIEELTLKSITYVDETQITFDKKENFSIE